MFSQKKKKFAYKTVVNKPFNQQSRITKNIDIVEFPDDFNSLSQSSKRQKVDTGKKTKDIITVEGNDLIPQEDLMDDDFDFSQAVDEIDQIEIAASQMMFAKSIPKQQPSHTKQKENQNSDILDELLSGTSKNFTHNGAESTFYLKIPKKKVLPNEHSQNVECSVAVTSEKNDNHKLQSEKRKYDIMQNTTSSNLKNEELLQKRQNELKMKKENDNIELLNTYKTKMQEAEQKYLSKDGEIGILRETLRKLSEDERKYKDKIQGLEYDLKTQQSDKEAKLVTEVEKLKTQLTFKEKEVQDVLEKQKKNSVSNVSSKSGPSHKKSPKVGFYSDAFEKSEKCDKSSASSFKNKNSVSERTSFQCKTFKNVFGRNMLEISPSKDIENLDCQVNLLENLKLNCDHIGKGIIDNDKTVDPSNNLLSLLELVKLNDFFVPEFVSKVTNYLNLLIELLASENQGVVQSEVHKIKCETEKRNFVQSKCDSENSPTKECIICSRTYNNGLHCLTILSDVPPMIKDYLLNGLVKYLGKEIEIPAIKNNDVKIDNKKYFLKYPNVSDFLLVKEKMNIDTSYKVNHVSNQFEVAVQFWTNLGQLMLLDSYHIVEKILFMFHISLQSYPLKNCSETHCLYLIDHQLISKYLTVVTVDRVLNVLDMLQKFIGLKSVTNLMCNKSDRCPLLLIYNWLINEDLQKDRNVLKVFQELVSFLSSLIAYDQNLAYNCLLESECRCSNEIIEFLITFLFDEFKHFQKEVFLSIESELKSNVLSRLSCFRQGISLFCLLCCNEKNLGDKRSAVECNYIYLLAGTIKMYRKIPSINDKEVLDLEDLLDMDQYIDFDDVPSEKMETNPTSNVNEVIVIG